MKTRLYLPILLFFLMPFTTAYSQMTDFSLIEKILQNENQSNESSENAINNKEAKPVKPKEEPNFENENYGYTGGKNFVNPPQEKFFDQPLSYFGYDFFVDAPTTFAPATNIPIPPDYVLGPEDNIRILLFGNQNSTYALKVTRDGEIFFPKLGPIAVAGLTFQGLKETIQEMVANQLIGTTVSITLGSLRSIDIFILGEAYQPGMYTISALSTLTNAIIKSGGINVTGSLRNIQLKRKGKVISTFDFYDLLLKGDTSSDIRLTHGDVVFIPPITKTVGVLGEVVRPGIYELKNEETLGDLLKIVGNLKPKADIFSANIQRVDPSANGFSLIPVDLNNSLQDSFELNNGDVLRIYPVVDNLKNVILVSGHALQPGFSPWREGLRINDLLRSSDDLLSMTDMSYVLIKREDESNQSYKFLQIDLEEIFKNEATDANILLTSRDEIILFPSLLSPEQITTRLIQDKYVTENNHVVLENEWTSLTYLRKSLMDQKLSTKENNALLSINKNGRGFPEEQGDIRRYYEYSIYDYCEIPEELAMHIIESTGFLSKKLISLEELENITQPEQITNLQKKIQKENERIKFQNTAKHEELTTTITSLCRRQLLDPVIEVINRLTTPTIEKRVISVFGSVHFPGVYPLTEEMILEDAIKSAGGFKDATYDAEIELSRSNNAGKKFTILNLFTSVSDTQAMETQLQEMDIINLKQISTKVETVEITGEVIFAGVYPIVEKQTLTELVKRAGGITKYGSVNAAYFQRKSLREADVERLKLASNELKRKMLLSSQTGAALGEPQGDNNFVGITELTSLVLNDAIDETLLGRLVIDLGSIMNGSKQNIMLEDGDSLHIPKTQQTVSVIGEVFVSNAHLYDETLNIDDYIALSGGATNYADLDSIYLVKSDGSIVPSSQLSINGFFRRNSQEGLQAGDIIVIPLDFKPVSGIKATAELTQIFYQMALAAAAVNSF